MPPFEDQQRAFDIYLSGANLFTKLDLAEQENQFNS